MPTHDKSGTVNLHFTAEVELRKDQAVWTSNTKNLGVKQVCVSSNGDLQFKNSKGQFKARYIRGNCDGLMIVNGGSSNMFDALKMNSRTIVQWVYGCDSGWLTTFGECNQAASDHQPDRTL